jgi:hypothetical protein
MQNAPEKIYNWIDSQLSIARYYGGCTYNGKSYQIDMQDPDRPLVRSDVLQREAKQKKDVARANKAAEKLKAKEAQSNLI